MRSSLHDAVPVLGRRKIRVRYGDALSVDPSVKAVKKMLESKDILDTKNITLLQPLLMPYDVSTRPRQWTALKVATIERFLTQHQ